MKRMATIGAMLMLGVLLASAQVPNGGFENWTNGDPDNWLSSNSVVGATIVESTTAHSGSYAAKGVVVSYYTVVIPPLIQTGVNGRGFAYSGRPGAMTGYYQLSTTAGDGISVSALLTKGGAGGVGIAGAVGLISTPASSYTQFSFPFIYASNDVPDTAYVQVTMSAGGSALNTASTFLIDDIAFSGTSGVAPSSIPYPQSFELNQNYPNPFNPTTSIRYGLPTRSHVVLTVFNSLGQEVKQLVNDEIDAGYHTVQFDGSGLASGMYFYRIQALAHPDAKGGQTNEFVQTKTLLLVK